MSKARIVAVAQGGRAVTLLNAGGVGANRIAAFPRRDARLGTSRPLSVRVTREQG